MLSVMIALAASQVRPIANNQWLYNTDADVYWKVNITYCGNPADFEYETLGIFIPGKYVIAKESQDNTFTLQINQSSSINGYTPLTAPFVVPVDTPGYAAMRPPTEYVRDATQFTQAGFIYLNPGCRGRNHGAPTGVTDLKAAIRYIRYSLSQENNCIPGNSSRIFSFGMSGGGAQSALFGVTGDSEMYNPYLEQIGAVSGYSDALLGSMCWCPITNLDVADIAYEWNLGMSRTGLNHFLRHLSENMALEFVHYINNLQIRDPDGNVLQLQESRDGIYQAGSYYDYLKSVVENSLNHFLSDTIFPYSVSSWLPFPGPLPFNVAAERSTISFSATHQETVQLNGDYLTPQDYIDALNVHYKWVNYEPTTNTATITSIKDFAIALKTASKNVGAFDDLNRAQGENILFGDGNGNPAHFDTYMTKLLIGTEYEQAYSDDLSKKDSAGNTPPIRNNLYNPMYYLMPYYKDGYQTSHVAPHFRIRTGINQGDTALCTEVNLALALQMNGIDVDFETVWGLGHVKAERVGDDSSNFIAWVNEILDRIQ